MLFTTFAEYMLARQLDESLQCPECLIAEGFDRKVHKGVEGVTSAVYQAILRERVPLPDAKRESKGTQAVAAIAADALLSAMIEDAKRAEWKKHKNGKPGLLDLALNDSIPAEAFTAANINNQDKFIADVKQVAARMVRAGMSAVIAKFTKDAMDAIDAERPDDEPKGSYPRMDLAYRIQQAFKSGEGKMANILISHIITTVTKEAANIARNN